MYVDINDDDFQQKYVLQEYTPNTFIFFQMFLSVISDMRSYSRDKVKSILSRVMRLFHSWGRHEIKINPLGFESASFGTMEIQLPGPSCPPHFQQIGYYTSTHQTPFLIFSNTATRHIWHTGNCSRGSTEPMLNRVEKSSFIPWGFYEKKVNHT